MLFQIVSDVHLKAGSIQIDFVEPSADVLIIAGDMCRLEDFTQFTVVIHGLSFSFKQIIFVAGNHEYYSMTETISQIKKKLRSLEATIRNFRFLDNEMWFSSLTDDADDIAIFGSTFFSHIPDNILTTYRDLNLPMRDTDRTDGRTITASTFNLMHYEARTRLESAIAYCNENNKKLIVVTHYAPSICCLDSKYYNDDPKNHLYFTECLNLYSREECLKAWVYGHTGHSSDFIIDNGPRVVSNQYDKTGNKKMVINI